MICLAESSLLDLIDLYQTYAHEEPLDEEEEPVEAPVNKDT